MSRKHKRRPRRSQDTQQEPSERKVEGGWDEESRANEVMNRDWEVRGDDVDR